MATAPDDHHQMQTPVNCDTCEDTAKHFCKNCHDRLCDRCKDIHSKSKATFDHEVVLLTFESLNFSTECPSSYVCKWHPKFRASIGCEKCEVPVCDQCLLGEHNGHNVIAIVQLFQYKKEKLDQKLASIRSELPKYESELEIVRRRQTEVSKNKDIVKKQIDDYFIRSITTLDESRHQLLNNVDKKTLEDLDLLKDKELFLQGYTQNMRKYMANIQNKDLKERMTFIFYTDKDENMSQSISFSIPGIIKYSEGRFDEEIVRTLSGRVYNCADDLKLLKEASMQIIRNLHLGKDRIVSLAYSSDPEAFWVYSSGKNAFVKYDEDGNQIKILKAKISSVRNKPICVVDNAHLVLFRNDSSKIFMFDNSQRKMFIDVAPMAVACICPTKDDDLFIGLVKSEQHLAIGRFSLTGECKQYITPLFGDWTPWPYLSNKNDNRLYVDDNINANICLSMGAVHVLHANGKHRFTYEGKEASLSQPFLSRGICTDVLGHILVADENNRGIHVLDKDGGFLTMLTVPGEPQTIPISLCIDRNNNLCIGCADGKIRILKYLD